MSDTPTTAEQVARLFHDHYERMAPEFGYATRPESAVPFDDVPAENRALMVATVAAVLDDIRNSPDALADLNGGEWVQVAERGRLDVQGDPSWYYGDGDCHLNRSTVRDYEPLFIFVPREAQQ